MRRALLISILLWPCLVWADSSEEINRLRLKNGMWSGLSLTTGSLSMTAPSARSTISLTALPGIAFGAEHWTSDEIGFELRGMLGAPATISNVLGREVGFMLHQFEGGMLFRHFMGLRATAPAWFVSSNLRVHMENVQEQRPSVLVSRVIMSPGIKIGHERFLAHDAWWLRVSLGASYPFFVRESPTDSGRPDDMVSVHAQVTSCYYFNTNWGVLVHADAVYQSFDHGGEATRAGGVSNVSVQDYYVTSLLGLRFVGD